MRGNGLHPNPKQPGGTREWESEPREEGAQQRAATELGCRCSGLGGTDGAAAVVTGTRALLEQLADLSRGGVEGRDSQREMSGQL